MNIWVATVATAALFVGAWQWPKFFLFCSFLGLLAGRTLIAISSIDIVKYIDEGIVLIALIAFPLKRVASGSKLRRFPGFVWFIAFCAMGLLSALIHTVPYVTALTGAFLMLKGPLLAWAVCQLNWYHRDLTKFCRWSSVVLLVIFLCTLINAAIPQIWLNWLLEDSAFAEDSRFGMPIIVGPFAHPGYFGTLMALAVLAILSYRHNIRKTHLSSFLLISSIVSMVAGFRRKTLLTFPLSLAGYARLARKRWLPLILIPSLGVLVMSFWGFISAAIRETAREYLTNPDQVARIRLTLDAPVVAWQNFPFGSGFGRFASGAARQDYSPIYRELGYPSIWGLGPTEENGNFLTDTFWPAVIGETGFFGTVFYACGLIAVALAAKRQYGGKDQWYRWLSMTVVLWSIHLALESLIEPVYSSTPVFGVYFGLVGIAAGYVSDRSHHHSNGVNRLRRVIT
ncbi:hypothetical protein ACSNO4_03810 [Kocuria flava]|uniref:hypothetical protein n=1 Tax=Kocuria flava TaxID=446860 RepID=UPI003F1ADE28